MRRPRRDWRPARHRPLGRLRSLVLVLVLAAPLTALPAPAAGQTAAPTLVCATCPTTSLAEAIAAAAPGDHIEVRGGLHPGGLTIDRPLTLIGTEGATIDGGGSGTVLRVVGADVAISGFTIRGTGTSHDHEDAAIVVETGRATIVGNRIEDALFGIYLKQASGSIVRDNVVIGKPLDVAMRGDGIKVWYSDDVEIVGNTASDGRDIILWYSNRGLVRDNTFDRGRYGLHLMYSNQVWIEGNSLRANSVGLYVMYGREITVIGNTLSQNHGPSGGGIGLKDVDGLLVEGNRFVDNQIAAQIDTSPTRPGIENVWRENVFAFNEIGIGFTPSVRHNTLTGNAFIDNTEHVAIFGRGQLRDITWAVDGRGNYWSDYAGYDADGDGIGDRPYQARQLFESLMDEQPTLRLFLYSPAEMAVNFAAKAFPEVRPEMKLEDPAPLMSPPVSPLLPPLAPAETDSRLVLGLGGFGVVVGTLAIVARLRPRPVRAAGRRRLATGWGTS